MAEIKTFSRGNLSSLILLIKNKYVPKAHKTGSTTEYKGLSDNDLTDELKNKYDAAHTHSQASHAPTDAQANVIEAVKVNGTALSIDNKEVDISVPTLSTDISTDKTSTAKGASVKAVYDYVNSAIASVSGGLTFKILEEGEYDPDTGVPTVEGNSNFIYLVPDKESANDVYTEYIYVDGKFEPIGKTAVDLTGYVKSDDIAEFTTEEINEIWENVMSS